jgi:hypothetical protein
MAISFSQVSMRHILISTSIIVSLYRPTNVKLPTIHRNLRSYFEGKKLTSKIVQKYTIMRSEWIFLQKEERGFTVDGDL